MRYILTKVLSELQPIQSKKVLTESDKAIQSRLLVQYNSIIDGGTPVEMKQNHIPVAPASAPSLLSGPSSSLSQQTQPSPTIRYSHPVGHKVITFNPKNKSVSPVKVRF